jgi:16S rRNA (cytidine1402-2'-O)-methyltransferase
MKENKQVGRLFLLPMMLGGDTPDAVIPHDVQKRITSLRYFVVENVRTTRRYLKLLDKSVDINSLTFFELSKHTDKHLLDSFFEPLLAGHDTGLISEAGVPCLADPGNVMVQRAHQKKIRVVPLTGPSSILLALIASGLNGQNFAFNGYLPVKTKERVVAIKKLEKRAKDENQSQIFMETPYRNTQLLEDVMKHCAPETKLTIAAALTSPDEYINTKTIREWKNKLPDLHKQPAVFVIL